MYVAENKYVVEWKYVVVIVIGYAVGSSRTKSAEVHVNDAHSAEAIGGGGGSKQTGNQAQVRGAGVYGAFSPHKPGDRQVTTRVVL